MNQPENMTLGSMIGKAESSSGPDVPNKVPEKESSLSDRFSFPGRIAVLAAVLFSPWALASVRFGPQWIIIVLMLIGLGFWWFETAFHERKSQVFPYIFVFVAAGLLIGIFQVIPLPSWLVDLFTGRQEEIYRNFSGNPNSTVTISLDREGTWNQIRLLVIATCGLLLGCRFFRTRRDAILLMSAVVVNGALISFVGIIQKVMGLPYGWYDLPEPLNHFGPFVNPNNAAGYLLLCLAAAIGLIVIFFSKPKNEKAPDVLKQDLPAYRETYLQILEFVSRLTAMKISLLILTGLITCGILATISRGGVVALIGGGIPTLLVYGVARKPKNSVFLFVPLLGLVVALTAWLGFADALIEKSGDIDIVNVSQADVRFTHWKETWPAVGAMGPLGSGLGSYRNVHRLYRSSHESEIFVYAENQFFQSVVEAGWPGLILFCLAWLLAFQCATLLLFKGNSSFSIGVGTAAVFLIFTQAIASCFDFGFYIGANLVLVSVLVGFICCHAQHLAGRLKKFSWLKFTTPNYIVQGVVLGLFAIAFVACLDLFRLAQMDSLMRPRAVYFDRDNMGLELTESRIEGLNKCLSNPLFRPLTDLLGEAHSVAALNHLGELHLHRSRLGIFQDLKRESEIQTFGFDPGAAETEQENAEEERVNGILWSLTDLQRMQEHASYLKRSQSRSAAREFLSSAPIKGNLPIALRAFQMSKNASPLQPIVHLRIGEIKGALADPQIGSGDDDIETCLELAPGNANFRLVAGVHYLQSNKPKAAVKHLRRYLELMPKKFRHLMAILEGTESRSITYLGQDLVGLEVIPDDPQMLFDFASDYMPENSEFKPAILKRAADILDQRPNTQREFTILSGDVNYAQGDVEAAVRDFKSALVSQPNDPDTRLKLAKALVDVGKTEEALEVAEELKGSSRYKNLLNYLNSR